MNAEGIILITRQSQDSGVQRLEEGERLKAKREDVIVQYRVRHIA